MNIFILDKDPEKAAHYHCDKHVVKMCLESVQILSSVWIKNGLPAPYRLTHENHPCVVWAGACRENLHWMLIHSHALFHAYMARYSRIHKSFYALIELEKTGRPNIPSAGGITPFAQAMPEEYKQEDAVSAYRNYYIKEKACFAKWEYTVTPDWWVL